MTFFKARQRMRDLVQNAVAHGVRIIAQHKIH
jgi:hypothetical protein